MDVYRITLHSWNLPFLIWKLRTSTIQLLSFDVIGLHWEQVLGLLKSNFLCLFISKAGYRYFVFQCQCLNLNLKRYLVYNTGTWSILFPLHILNYSLSRITKQQMSLLYSFETEQASKCATLGKIPCLLNIYEL